NLSAISCSSASSASASSLPTAMSVSFAPMPAASIITPMMLLPLTSRPSRRMRMSDLKRDAVVTSFAAARACRPSLLTMVTERSINASLLFRRRTDRDAALAAFERVLRHRGEVEARVVVDPHQHRQVDAGDDL